MVRDSGAYGSLATGNEALHFLSKFVVGFYQPLMTTLTLIETLLELCVVMIA